jgi:hypothetical protein
VVPWFGSLSALPVAASHTRAVPSQEAVYVTRSGDLNCIDFDWLFKVAWTYVYERFKS